MPKAHLYINESAILKIKQKFPTETGLLNMTETVEWALKQVLKNDCLFVGEQKPKKETPK